ncbi:MAG: hypothetical protein WDN75_02240 [Bacteroidota bacterium]
MKQLHLIVFLGFILSVSGLAAQSLTIEECYELAKKNYPLIRQKELLVKSMEFTIANAQSGLPAAGCHLCAGDLSIGCDARAIEWYSRPSKY